MRPKRIITMILLLIFIAAVTSCASMELENYTPVGLNILYEENFTEGEEIEYLKIDAHAGYIRQEENALHFHAAENGDGNGASYKVALGDGVHISFRMMLGADNPSGHPSSHINFLWNDAGGRICINFDQENIGGFINYPGGGEGPIPQISQTGLRTNQWYDLTFIILDRKLTMFKNGSRLKSISLNDKIPRIGKFILECHQDMWIDDLVISRIDDFVLKEK